MDSEVARALEDCYRILEESGDLEACLKKYPDLAGELRAHLILRGELRSLKIPEPEPVAASWAKRDLIAAVQVDGERRKRRARMVSVRAAGIVVGFALLSAAAVGASAASGRLDVRAELNDAFDTIGVRKQSPDPRKSAAPAVDQGTAPTPKQGDLATATPTEGAGLDSPSPAAPTPIPPAVVTDLPSSHGDVATSVDGSGDPAVRSTPPLGQVSPARGGGETGGSNPGNENGQGQGNGNSNPGNGNGQGQGDGNSNPGNENGQGQGNGNSNPGNGNGQGQGDGSPNPGNGNGQGQGNGSPNPGNGNGQGQGNGSPNPGNGNGKAP